MLKKDRNYWPHAIIISLLLIVLACVYTIVESLKYPVEMDTFYMQGYHEVDKNYDKIEALQKSFDEKYNVNYKMENMHIGDDNKIEIFVSDKLNASVLGASAELLVTRPETNSYNQMFNQSLPQNDAYIFSPINMEKGGRWQFQVKITIGEDIGFFKREVNVTR
jgi:hypothetical protein